MQRNSQVEEDVIKIGNLLLAIRIPSGFKSVDFVQKMELKFVDFDNLKERERHCQNFALEFQIRKKRLFSLQYKMCFKVSRTKMA
jgi:hypothetical protein